MNPGIYKTMREYFGNGWNLMDIVRILLQIGVILCHFLVDNTQNAYLYSDLKALVILMSWFSFLGSLRIFPSMRDLIQQVVSGVEAMSSFLVVLFVLLIGSTMTMWSKKLSLERPFAGEAPPLNRIWMQFVEELISQVKLAFGEINTEDPQSFNWVTLVITAILLFFTTLLLMNVLIGIISESVGRVYDARVRTNYYVLCGIILDTELIMFW